MYKDCSPGAGWGRGKCDKNSGAGRKPEKILKLNAKFGRESEKPEKILKPGQRA